MIFMCVCICKGVGNSGFKNQLLWRQDGRIEGCELTSSYENTTITTDEQASTKKTLEPIKKKKDTLHPKTKNKPQQEGKMGSQKQ